MMCEFQELFILAGEESRELNEAGLTKTAGKGRDGKGIEITYFKSIPFLTDKSPKLGMWISILELNVWDVVELYTPVVLPGSDWVAGGGNVLWICMNIT